MDELKGPTIQIVLHVKEGLGFGFLRVPFIVSGSLNGYMLETDPVVPSHAPSFDAELVWEADKRRFRSLRVQNVPIKVEVFTMGTQGRKDKVGYLLLSLLGAQPCPASKIVDVRHSWHRLLGVKSEGKCCHPQLMLSLSVEDRVNTITPRNELRMFHSNDVAYPTTYNTVNPTAGLLLTLTEYIAESKKTVSSPDLQPNLLCDEGLIQIGDGKHLFVLSFVIGSVENIDMLIPDYASKKDATDCYVSYTVFTHTITTDRVSVTVTGSGAAALFNQRTSLRLRADLSTLARYFAECPSLVTAVRAADRDVGICSMDLRKLVPTDNIEHFLNNFCNEPQALSIHERCFILRTDGQRDGDRKPYVDVDMSLKYVGVQTEPTKPLVLSARSATQLENRAQTEVLRKESILNIKSSGSCTNLEDVGGVAYTNNTARNTSRYKDASGAAIIQTNEITELIRKMCDSFALSQEKLLAAREKPLTSDMQVQCETQTDKGDKDSVREESVGDKDSVGEKDSTPVKLETSKSDTCIRNDKDMVKRVIPYEERDNIMQKFVDELEDWKEKQQELYKIQLQRKEEYHLELLSREWSKKRTELESKLGRGVEQCRRLAADLARATDDFRLRGYRNTEREKKLLDAKNALETHYTAKYQELREASQKMEDDMNHRLKLKDMRIEELEAKVMQLERQLETMKINAKNIEKESESKYSGLTKDQTASLIQELRCLEQKLDSAVQSKAFFKEQWGRAVRELHLHKLHTRRQMLAQLRHDRRQLGQMGLDTIQDQDEKAEQVDMERLKDDFYVDILANMPVIESNSIISTTGPELDMFDEMKTTSKNPKNERLSELIAERDRLVKRDSPDEDRLQHLNQEIRSILLNCGSC
ncbi:centrosomal protein of 120 kDa-like [Cydia pomonella]|uniref:centrosomal protein of 120 kDa-like n=1 Tax=Cydia pomonella TaxID=82600 RepID=UPI002ADD3AEF|nr:centrosomal protein of 120 kDa-like [Cydia pomonella]